ncbi:SDR family NAD(P)-dependent oxidoreductase [Georgenia subflava]|uniref:SDR family NAD(P)-dependent oxidoreductase n=1 Tax=Georgenia subflava TaxID=1622177 RepID=A0A6N7EBC6_9MICO|nr:SDR family NAD(P)-dependent oxidoreductase [Georgenia subflava]MPV35692.1 SDR family NAD(P)-dependent oxidoreductase [Georgenia subflava]
MTAAGSRVVLVTGASTGIGHAAVAHLVRAGFRVWATVRQAADAERLRAEHPGKVRTLHMDLLDDDSVRAVGEEVCAAGALHSVVNNAGAALPGPLELLPVEVLRRQLDINLVGQLAVTQAVMPALWQAREAGDEPRIVMLGSIGGRIAGPVLGPYHAAKFGLVGLTDTLRAELAPFGIRVVLVEPGVIATPIWQRGLSSGDQLTAGLPTGLGRYGRQAESARASATRNARHGAAPELVARAITAAVTDRRPRPRVLVGRDAKVTAALVRMLPARLLYRVTAARR